ncbi:MAG: tetratricopeptide repeat protein, partial [Bacteroidota bacterium]
RLNSLGYVLLRKKQLNDAIRVFELNVQEYPASANTYDSWGEALLSDGQLEKAKIQYQKALELDPESQNAKKMLEEIAKRMQ